MFFAKKKYDLIFGMGEACSCSSSLRRADLQIRSFPFDWIYGSTIPDRIKMITDEFQNFLSLENLEYTGRNNGIPEHLCDIYINRANGLTFNHDFPSGVNPAEVFDKVNQKYQRRSLRLIEKAKNSKTILVVWLDSPGSRWKKKNREDFIEGQKLLQEKFKNAKVDFLVFEWDKNIGFKERKYEKFNDNIELYTFDYQFHHSKKQISDYVVDEKMLLKILKNYELNMSFKEKFENFKRKHLH